VGSSANNSKR